MKAISRQQTELSPDEKRTLLAELMDQDNKCNGLYPLSLAQQRLWFLEQLEPGMAAHNISAGLRLIGELDTGAVRRAVGGVVARHETLRTAFLTLPGGVFQRISAAAHLEIPVADLRALPESTRDRDAYDLACEEAWRPFDLQCSPLLRLKLMRMRNEDHILLFTMHHLVSDGWSIGVFLREFTELYEADREGRKCDLPSIPIQYADYAQWERESLGDQELLTQVRYWRMKLAGIRPLLELPADRVRPAEQSLRCGVLSVPLPALLVEELKEFAQREETTLFTVLLAAFNVLLYRYTNQEDVCVGVPVAGRRHVETEDLIGLFVNTLVIRTDMSGNPRFTDLVAQVRDVSLQAHANQDVAFERVVEELQPTRSLTYHPVFQVMMTALREPLRKRRFAGLTASPYVVATATSLFDLAALVFEAADGTFWWRLEYSTALFDAARIQRMAGHYGTLLENILQNPERRIGDLALLTSAELEQLSVWNRTAAEYPKECVHELIAAQAARSPDRVAVICGERQLTYAELNHEARQVAGALRAAGVRPGSRVAVCFDRAVEMIVGVLGVLHAGAAYVPMDPAGPAERLSFVMEDAGAALLLTQRDLMVRLPGTAGHRVLIEDALILPPGGGPEPPDPESLAYVIYTSGSTGKPKGVCVPHRALVNLLTAMLREPGLTTNDRLLAVTNPCFDISALELFLPLIAGARLVIADKDAVADGSRLVEKLRRDAITIMQATPSTWRLLIGAGWSRAAGELKVLCGGEALSVELANELMDRSDFVWNLYGPTETTVWSSVSPVRRDSAVTIGRPIQNTQFYVLDRRMRRVPVGVPGELYIGGAGVARGYQNQPNLTDKAFVTNPFDPAGSKLYKTGDEVRYRADGEIEYLGRLDLQVKIRGFRIELGEIESVAAQHPDIRQALAMVREDTPGDKRLVCYIVRKPGATVSASGLRAAIQDQLPDYMLPMVVVLDALPLTPNGKIDLAQLTAPSPELSEVGAPRDEVERRLLAIWKQVLRLEEIGIRDNFFDLGGHSLLAIQLLAQIERTFGSRLPVAMIFKAQTVEQMAAALRQTSWKPWSPLVAIHPEGVRTPLFVIPLPDGNVLGYADFARTLGPDQPVYVLQYAGVEGRGRPVERIEVIAEHFIREIRKVQPHGPYCLAGFCVGGVIAYEMAQQLVACGEEVPLVALVETWHPSSIPRVRATPAAFRPFLFVVHGVGRHLGAMLRLPPRRAFRYFREKSAIIKEMMFHRDVYRGDRYNRYSKPLIEANYRAGSRYVPAPFAGRLLLLHAGNRDIGSDTDTRLVWRDLALGGCVVVRTAASSTLDLLKKPHVKALADGLAEQLRASQSLAGDRASSRLVP